MSRASGRGNAHDGPRPHHHVTGRNPAHPPIQRYAPSVWHRDHRYALGLTIGATVLTLVSGALYARVGAQGFWVMAALCVPAFPLTWKLRQPALDLQVE